MRRTCRRAVRFILLAAACCLIVVSAGVATGVAADKRPVLLVHGMAWDVDIPKPVWGSLEKDAEGREQWTGMVGFLENQGWSYGGTLKAGRGTLEMPACLDPNGATVEPRDARLFVLEFSAAANTDGLAHKGLELAEAVRQLCRFTGARKVDVVVHSAGGLAARTYLQGALPGVPYRGDVDRLVTIATPHLGAAVASQVGDLLGTRATSLKHDAPLIVRLNTDLDLPDEVRFASIVVRGFSADVRGKGDAYKERIDARFVARLPVDYREGGDQLVHVLSQNLRLAPCAARYEEASGLPIQYALARVDDPSRGPGGRRVHGAAPLDEGVQQLVAEFLTENSSPWKPCDFDKFAEWLDRQARLHAVGLIEWETLRQHRASEVREVDLARFQLVKQEGQVRSYEFDGEATSVPRAMPLRRQKTHGRGTLHIEFDRFGRVVGAEATIKE
ncbi:MAG TPA: hypothetical protein DD670_08060 [Planctomycetaceae bacterium]|nr:hypothetical protein [Planctomycetaceae bacterium]